MQSFLVTIHIITAICLVLIILMQQSKGGGLSGMFGGGGGGMDDILTAPGSDVFLKKATITLAAIFFLTSLVLGIRTLRERPRSLLENQPVPTAAPVEPAAEPIDVPAPAE